MHTRNAPRSQVLGTLTMQAVLSGRMHWNEYAAAVVEHYHRTVDVAGQVGTPCELLRCAADAVQAIMPMLEDNHRIGPEDAAHADAALHAIADVQSVCTTLAAQIAAAKPQDERRGALKAVQG